MPDVVMLDMDIRSPSGALTNPEVAGRVDVVDCYALAEADLSGYAALIVPSMVDQEHLARHRDVVRGFLDGGGVVVFGGHLHRDWLPGAAPFVPVQPPSLRAYRVTEVADHPIFDGVDPTDLTFRRGVAGFFARGHHPPPEGAEVLTRLAGEEPATYLDRVSTAGTIVVQSSGDLLGYAGGLDSTAARIPAQLLDWVVAEAGRRRATLGPVPAAPPAPAPRRPADPPVGGGLVALYGGSAQHHRSLTTPKYARHLAGTVYLPDLPEVDLTRYAGLVIPERLHRDLLTRGAGRIAELLQAGGTVIAFAGGEPLPEFLPGVRWEHRPTNYWWWLEPGADLGLHSPTPQHSLFDHLAIADCTWHYHGVVHPPEGAEVLVALPSGEAVLYVDQVSTPGTLVVATLDPLSHFGAYFMPATERFLDGFLPWAAAEAQRVPTGAA